MRWHIVEDYRQIILNPEYRQINKRRKISLIHAGFDIETTNIINRNDNGDIEAAYSIMYHWQFCIDNNIILGRTWQEFDDFIKWLDSNLSSTLIIWVANLGFEFSFLMGHYEIKKCFAKTAWKPLYFTILNHLEFRDCLQVTGGNLAYLAKNYCSPDNQKLKGDLDFTKIRHCKTELTEKEKQYCINDVTILSEFAGYMFDTFQGELPLTKTGILRNEVKERFAALKPETQEYIRNLLPDSIEYSKIMKYLFQGGFTHANFLSLNQVFSDVTGIDIASSYPAVMLQEYFPMSKFLPCEIECDGNKITDTRLDTECVYFTAVFSGVKCKYAHTILSEHKMMYTEGAKWDNGRLLSARVIKVMMTEIDYKIFSMFYTWKKCAVRDGRVAKRGKLPEYLTGLIKKYYSKKCILKKEGKKDTLEYQLSKEKVNSFYGMCVTKIVLKDLIFENIDKNFKLAEKVKPWFKVRKSTVLSPYWGIYVTCHARFRLLKMIHDITLNSDGFSDCCYSDTDSIYLKNFDKHKEIIEKFNDEIREKNKEFGEVFDTLGTFEIDGKYDKFKTLGAKRYMTEKHGEYQATIAGVDGDIYIKEIPPCDNPFEWFSFDKTHYLDLSVSGKKGHHYFYNPDKYLTINDGVSSETVECFSGCAIYDIPFNIKINDVWMDLIIKICTDRGIL